MDHVASFIYKNHNNHIMLKKSQQTLNIKIKIIIMQSVYVSNRKYIYFYFIIIKIICTEMKHRRQIR